MNKFQLLGQLEKEVMEIVWLSKSPISVKSVHETIIKQRKAAYTTIMTIMGRLTSKGLLKRRGEGKAYLYQPVYSKDKFLTRVTRQIIKNFVSNFGDTAIAHFAQEVEKIPAAKRQELLKLLKKQNGK